MLLLKVFYELLLGIVRTCWNIERSIIFKPRFDLGSSTVSSAQFIGISSHDLSFLWHKEPRFSFTQVVRMSAFVKCHDNLIRRYLRYKSSLLFGWRGSLLILFKIVVVVSKSSALCFWLSILKLKYLPKYLKLSSSCKGDIISLSTYSLALVWGKSVFFFLMPNVWHLSTLIIILLQIHHVEKVFNRIWVLYSWPVNIVALSANWNQCVGRNKFVNK